MTTPSSHYSLLPAILILVVLFILAAGGAGIYGWSLAGSALILALATLLTRRPADPDTSAPPCPTGSASSGSIWPFWDSWYSC